MTNKEHVVISRQYVSLLKVRLGLKIRRRRNMTKFEFVLNKFYEITAWSLFAAVAMTVLNGDYDTVPASLCGRFHYCHF